MRKKVYIDGKKVKWSDLSAEEVYLHEALSREKKLTAYWYQRISGQVAWKEGERERLNVEMESMAMEIDHIIGRRELKSLEV